MQKRGIVALIAALMCFTKTIAVEIEYPKVIISEVLPAPDKTFSQVEYIELFNPTDNNYTLNNWSIVDLKGDSYSLNGLVIDANDYLVLGGDDFNITLNDNDEKIALVNPDNSIVDSIGWESSTKGYSWSLLNDGSWSITTINPNKSSIEASILKANQSDGSNIKSQSLSANSISDMQIKSAQENTSSKKKSTSGSNSSSSTNTSSSAKKTVSNNNNTSAIQSSGDTASGQQDVTDMGAETDSPSSNYSYVKWIIIGSLFILYIVYEFRKELRFYYHQFRGKSKIGGENIKVIDKPSYYIVGQ